MTTTSCSLKTPEEEEILYVTASLGAANKISRNAEVGVVLSELGSDKFIDVKNVFLNLPNSLDELQHLNFFQPQNK